MFKDISILIVSAAVVVAAVKYLLISGIGNISAVFKLSSKTRGQIIGYATSIPEFTVLVAGAFAGVFSAGLWNIVSSNIINCVLFLITVVAYRQQLDLKSKWFTDEIIFGALSLAVPILLLSLNLEVGFAMASGLIFFFVVYRICDKLINQKGIPAPLPEGAENGTLFKGLLYLVSGVVVILIAGRYLSISAGSLVIIFNIPAWAIGWILGFISSVSELTSFIEIYKIHEPKRRKGYIKDTQEAIDALVTSNISNVGLILPIGIIIYLLMT
jgi:Ca2+/Na+ antiporter